MTTSNSRSLQFRFESNVAPVKAAMADLASSVAGNMATVGTAMLGAARAADTGFVGSIVRVVGAVGTLKIATVAASVAMGAAILEARKQLKEMVDVADAAAKRGVSPEFFQSFSAYSKSLRIEAKELQAALATAFETTKEKLDTPNALQKRLDDFSSRGFFKSEAGFDVFDRFVGASAQEDKIRAALEAIRELQAAGRDLAALDIAESLFGSGFADKIRTGQVSVFDLMRTLDDLSKTGAARGDIFSNENVKRAEDYDRRLKIAYATIADQLKPALDTLPAVSLELQGIWLRIAESIAGAAKSAGEFVSSISRGSASSAALQQAVQSNPFYVIFQALRNVTPSAAAVTPDPTGITNGKGGLEASGMTLPTSVPNPRRRPVDAPTNVPKEPAFSLDQVERYLNSLERSNDVITAQIENINKSNAEREVAVRLAEAEAQARARGTALTEKEREQVVALANAHSNLADRLKNMKQAQQEFAEAVRYVGSQIADAFGDAILEGKKFDEVVNSLVKNLARMALQAAFTGQGPLSGILGFSAPASQPNQVGGIFGSLFNGFRGFFAEGGTLPANSWGIAGENGPEPIFSGPRPLHVMKSGSGVGGGSVVVQVFSSPNFQAGMTPTDMAYINVALERNSIVTRNMTIDAIQNLNRANSGAMYA